MNIVNLQWETIFIFCIFCLGLCMILLFVSYLASVENKLDNEKSSPFECGFHPFMETRYRFEVKFYIISILFIVFDVEVLYFFPLAMVLPLMSSFSMFLFLFFVIILIVGLIFEISRDALDF